MPDFFPETQPPEPYIVEPASGVEHTASVLVVHGYGDDAHGWEFLPSTHGKTLPHIRWILPSAPMEPGDTLGIVGMRSWFEISNEAIEKWKEHGKKDASVVDEPTGNVEMLPGVVKAEGDVLKAFIPAVRYLHSLIDAELAKGIPSEKIAIVGFSQGGALALLLSLFGEQRWNADGSPAPPAPSGKYAGIFPIGTFLPGGEAWLDEKRGVVSEANLGTLCCLMHGTSDMLVPPLASQTTLSILQKLGFKGAFYLPYNGVQHWVTDKQVSDLGKFIGGILG